MARFWPCYAFGVGKDTKAIIGTIVGTGLVVAGLLSAQISAQSASLNTRIDDLRAEMSDTRADTRDMRAEIRDMRAVLNRFDSRLDAIEIALGKIDQRLLAIERLVLPAPVPGEQALLAPLPQAYRSGYPSGRSLNRRCIQVYCSGQVRM